MTDISRKKVNFRRAAMLSGGHFVLNLALLIFGMMFMAVGHGDNTLWYVAVFSCYIFNITLFSTVAFSFLLRNQGWKWMCIFYVLLLLFFVYLVISIWLLTPGDKF